MPALPPLPLPRLVNVESTLGCNLECVMCGSHLSGVTKVRRVMEPALLDRVEAQAARRAIDLSLTVAGEPFMTPRLSSFVAVAERTGASLQLNTNGTLLRDDPTLRRILAQSSEIRVSIDAPDPAVYASIRGKAELDSVLANTRLLVRLAQEAPRRPIIAIAMVLMRRNVALLPAMVGLAHGLGADRLDVAHLTVLDEAMEAESLRHDPASADAALAAAAARADALGFRVSLPPPMAAAPPRAGLRARARRLQRDFSRVDAARVRRLGRIVAHTAATRLWELRAGGRVPCHFLRGAAFVSIGGDVAPCPMPGRPVAGNLLQDDFDAIWNGPVLSAMRRGFIDGAPFECCRHCSQNPQGYRPDDPATVRPRGYTLPRVGRRS